MFLSSGEVRRGCVFSLRRHYPVQVIGYYLSLPLGKHPGNSNG
jgi:hypothetical protein